MIELVGDFGEVPGRKSILLDEIVQCMLAAELGLLSLMIDPVLLGGYHCQRLRPRRTERELEEGFLAVWLFGVGGEKLLSVRGGVGLFGSFGLGRINTRRNRLGYDTHMLSVPI